MEKILAVIVGIVGGLLIAAIFAFICAFPVMWLWNGFMPDVLNVKEINLREAFCLLLLCKILFDNSSSDNKE